MNYFTNECEPLVTKLKFYLLDFGVPFEKTDLYVQCILFVGNFSIASFYTIYLHLLILRKIHSKWALLQRKEILAFYGVQCIGYLFKFNHLINELYSKEKLFMAFLSTLILFLMIQVLIVGYYDNPNNG